MIDDLGGTTAKLVSLALDAASMRHMAIANNVANVNSRDYVPVKVNFEEQLAAVKNSLVNQTSETASSNQLLNIKPFIEADASVGNDGAAGVKLDVEMAKMAQNVIHYQALLKGMANKMSVIRLAINEGRK